MNALLIVDVQNDFCPGGSLAVKDGDDVVHVINGIMDRFDLVVASKDWHPMQTRHFEKWPRHCVQQTPGAAFHPLLNEGKIKHVFLKGTGTADDGYSAFEATNQNLDTFLRTHQVKDLYVAGLATDFCVRASALDAKRLGFQVYLVEDAIRGVNQKPGDAERAIEEMKREGIVLIKTAQIPD